MGLKGPVCPKCRTGIPPGLALFWAPPSGFACENPKCDAWLRMSRWRNFAIAMGALTLILTLGRQFEGWDFALFIAALCASLVPFAWFAVKPELVTGAKPR